MDAERQSERNSSNSAESSAWPLGERIGALPTARIDDAELAKELSRIVEKYNAALEFDPVRRVAYEQGAVMRLWVHMENGWSAGLSSARDSTHIALQSPRGSLAGTYYPLEKHQAIGMADEARGALVNIITAEREGKLQHTPLFRLVRELHLDPSSRPEIDDLIREILEATNPSQWVPRRDAHNARQYTATVYADAHALPPAIQDLTEPVFFTALQDGSLEVATRLPGAALLTTLAKLSSDAAGALTSKIHAQGRQYAESLEAEMRSWALDPREKMREALGKYAAEFRPAPSPHGVENLVLKHQEVTVSLSRRFLGNYQDLPLVASSADIRFLWGQLHSNLFFSGEAAECLFEEVSARGLDCVQGAAPCGSAVYQRIPALVAELAKSPHENGWDVDTIRRCFTLDNADGLLLLRRDGVEVRPVGREHEPGISIPMKNARALFDVLNSASCAFPE